jgi:hypothetical protein
VAWRADAEAVGAPRLVIDVPFAAQAKVEITWSGAAIDANTAQAEATASREGLTQYRQGDFSWWQLAPATPVAAAPGSCTLEGPRWTAGTPIRARQVDLAPWFNDRVTEIFKPGKYVSPRAPNVTLALPTQGLGAWAGHVNQMAKIDDSGFRALGGTLTLPNGLKFATPAGAGTPNVIFASQWDNYPREVTVPLEGRAGRAFLLLAGSTNYMQSRIDNGEIVATYADGTESRLALRNPDNWWPIDQDYFIDDYQFPLCGSIPMRVELKSAQRHVRDTESFTDGGGGEVVGGAASVLELPLDPTRPLKSLTVRALANDVVIGLMGVTLDQAAQ